MRKSDVQAAKAATLLSSCSLIIILPTARNWTEELFLSPALWLTVASVHIVSCYIYSIMSIWNIYTLL